MIKELEYTEFSDARWSGAPRAGSSLQEQRELQSP